MDKIEMIIQKYGDKIQVGYQALLDQYIVYNILLTFSIISIAVFLASTFLLTFINYNYLYNIKWYIGTRLRIY